MRSSEVKTNNHGHIPLQNKVKDFQLTKEERGQVVENSNMFDSVYICALRSDSKRKDHERRKSSSQKRKGNKRKSCVISIPDLIKVHLRPENKQSPPNKVVEVTIDLNDMMKRLVQAKRLNQSVFLN